MGAASPLTRSIMQPTVSVIMATHNRAQVIGAAIDSILAQTYDAWELIVVANGTTDDTPAVLARYAKDPRIRVLTEARANKAGALNVGIRAAQGEHIALQDDDDISLPERLATCAAAMRAHPEWDALIAPIGEFAGEQRDRILARPDGRLFYRRALWEKVGYYREFFRSVEDVDFDFRCEEASAHYGRLADVLYLARQPQGEGRTDAAPLVHSSYAPLASHYRLVAWVCKCLRRDGLDDLVEQGHDLAQVMEILSHPKGGLERAFWRRRVLPRWRTHARHQATALLRNQIFATTPRSAADEIALFETALKNWNISRLHRFYLFLSLRWSYLWARLRPKIKWARLRPEIKWARLRR